ncbi:MAG TPA: NAD(P)H-hydrate epimerase [Pirellulaceae bacterium]|nr:NAD(P)H-hydrate epimerase [Pirellulaceae bacterium]HMO93526.1 NAD(P)H-hydrate epimerase [Pirellulaceae bacterium]HMP70362.1 NAD(P)H-hydrate epimerase [Pirellulaceae bacterium]
MHSDSTVLSTANAREFDRLAIEVFHVPSLLLMENAARGCTDALEAWSRSDVLPLEQRVVIVCGRGNNGGDGLAIARQLVTRGYQVDIGLLADEDELSSDAAVHWKIVNALNLSCRIFGNPQALDSGTEFQEWLEQKPCDWIVDAILGTGIRLPLAGGLQQVIRAINKNQAKKLAVDLPTGLQGDAVEPQNAADNPIVLADFTVTFVARKPIMATDFGKKYCGLIKVVDIGVPLDIVGKTIEEIN